MTPRYPDTPDDTAADTAADAPRIAVYAGSFDPFTRGHLSIALRAAAIFDEVVIAIGVNAAKAPSEAALAARLAGVERAMAAMPPELRSRCSATVYSGELTTALARRLGARWLVRGARSGSEFDAEMSLADINRRISGIETVIIPALPELASCSSSVVRELQSYGLTAEEFLP